MADLKVMDEFAESASNEPCLSDVAYDSRWQTDQNDEQVRRRQIYYEQIRHRPHLSVLPDDDTNQRVAGQSTDEHGSVQHDKDPLEGRREDVVANSVDVVVVANAEVVGAVLRRSFGVVRLLSRHRRRHLVSTSVKTSLQGRPSCTDQRRYPYCAASSNHQFCSSY